MVSAISSYFQNIVCLLQLKADNEIVLQMIEEYENQKKLYTLAPHATNLLYTSGRRKKQNSNQESSKVGNSLLAESSEAREVIYAYRYSYLIPKHYNQKENHCHDHYLLSGFLNIQFTINILQGYRQVTAQLNLLQIGFFFTCGEGGSSGCSVLRASGHNSFGTFPKSIVRKKGGQAAFSEQHFPFF